MIERLQFYMALQICKFVKKKLSSLNMAYVQKKKILEMDPFKDDMSSFLILLFYLCLVPELTFIFEAFEVITGPNARPSEAFRTNKSKLYCLIFRFGSKKCIPQTKEF